MTFNSRVRWGAVLTAGALAIPAVAAQAAPAQPSLQQAVTAKVSAAKTSKATGSSGVQVNVTRGAGTGTVFGTTVALVPRGQDTHPEGWLFAARLVDGKWQV